MHDYTAQEHILRLIDKMKVKPDEQIMLNMVEQKPSIISAFPDASNRVKERARMFAKRDTEASWRR